MNPRPSTLTFRQYSRQLFSKSLFCGWPQIARSRGLLQKSKISLFVLCLVGFLYQANQFAKILLQFPVSMVIEVEYPPAIEVPGITVCTGNTIHLGAYCRDFPDHCNGSNELLPEYQDIESRPITRGMFKKYGIPWETARFHLKKQWNRKEHGHEMSLLHFPVRDSKGRTTLCYVLNQHVLEYSEDLLKIPTIEDTLTSFMLNTISIFVQNPNKVAINPNRGFLNVHLHSPYELSNPFTDGIIVSNGLQTLLVIEVTEIRRLPPPYQTNCRDYFADWMKYKKGPLTKNSCIQECIAQRIAQACNCFQVGVLYLSDLEFCTPEDRKCVENVDVEECYTQKCQLDCVKYNFEYIKVEKAIEKTFAIFEQILILMQDVVDFSNISSIKQVTGFHLLTDSYEKITYEYKPKYEVIEIFGYLGGYLGIWLGLSLIAFGDLFEICFLLLFFAIRRMKTSGRPQRPSAT